VDAVIQRKGNSLGGNRESRKREGGLGGVQRQARPFNQKSTPQEKTGKRRKGDSLKRGLNRMEEKGHERMNYEVRLLQW